MERQPISEINNPQITPADVKQSPTIERGLELNDVPVDILRQFDIDHRTLVEGDKEKLNNIYNWVAKELPDPTPGNVMQTIRDIQAKLGGDRSFTKVWAWLRIKQNVGDLIKKQRAMEHGNIWSA